MKNTVRFMGVSLASITLVATSALAGGNDANRDARRRAIRELGSFFRDNAYVGKTGEGQDCFYRSHQTGLADSGFSAEILVKNPSGGILRGDRFRLDYNLGDDENFRSDVVGHANVNRRISQVEATAEITPVDPENNLGTPFRRTLALTEVATFDSKERGARISGGEKPVSCYNLKALRSASPSTEEAIEALRNSEILYEAAVGQIVEAIRADASLSLLPQERHEALARELLSPGHRNREAAAVIEDFQFFID